MGETLALAEVRRKGYNTVRLHSSLWNRVVGLEIQGMRLFWVRWTAMSEHKYNRSCLSTHV